MNTAGWACPNASCEYYGETDASRHAVIGHGKMGRDKTIQRLKRAACVPGFTRMDCARTIIGFARIRR